MVAIVSDFTKGFNAVLHPGANTSTKMSVGQALGMYYRFSIIPAILFMILGAVLFSALGALLGPVGAAIGGGVGAGIAIVYAILVFWIAIPIGALISAALYHIVGMYVSGFKSGYSATFTGVTYQMMTIVGVLWLAFIPVIGAIIVFVFELFSIYVLCKAWSNQHKTSVGKAFLTWLVWLIIGIIITVLFMGAALSSLTAPTTPIA